MLTFFNGDARRFCDGLTRRSFLRTGGLVLGGLALSDFLRLRAEGAVASGRRGKSVIMICLGGGPSHVDMYDMKPGAPSEIRGEFRPIPTNVAGVGGFGLFLKQAKKAGKIVGGRNATGEGAGPQRVEDFLGD